MVAYLIDAAALSLVGGAFPFLLIQGSGSGDGVRVSGSTSIVISLIYFTILWSRVGAGRSLGMRILGLRVVDLNGELLGLRGAFIRALGLWLSFAVCFLGVIWVAFDGRRQGWHDKLAGSLVVRRAQ